MFKFDETTPFILIARVTVKADCIEKYIQLAKITDDLVNRSEPQMLHHTFDQDIDNATLFTWSELYANDNALIYHINNPVVIDYLEKHIELSESFTIEVYGTISNDCENLLRSLNFPLKLYRSVCGYTKIDTVVL